MKAFGDEELIHDTVEGETNAFEEIDYIVDYILADEARIAVQKQRLARFEERTKKRRAFVMTMLQDVLNRDKIERPSYTANVSRGSPGVQITDETAIPKEFWKYSVDSKAVLKALKDGREVAGASLTNPIPHLTLTVK